MAEKPILCAAPVVRAILDGRQTQDRRPVKPQPPAEIGGALTGGYWFPTHDSGDPAYRRARCYDGEAHFRRGMPIDFGPWHTGDVLYVRETWRPYIRGWSSHVQYRAGNQHLDRPVCGPSLGSDASDAAMEWCAARGGVNEIECKNPDDVPWFPSIHMPKWAARIHLRVLSVGVERVNAISEEDAEAEGCSPVYTNPFGGLTAKGAFAELWDSLYGAGSFDRGDWCWVTRFERVTP